MRMRLRAIGGPLVIVLWQTVPLQTAPDSLGRTRITFGFGRGAYESDIVTPTCDGGRYYEKVAYRAGGVRVDTWPDDRVRLTGFGSVSSHQAPEGDVTHDATPWTWGGEVALEVQSMGIGVGYTRLYRYTGIENRPSFYLRLGDMDQGHFRFDLAAPGPTHGSTGYWRIGLANNMGHLRGVSWYGGLSVCHFCGQHSRTGVFTEFTIPGLSWLDLVFQGRLSGSEDSSWTMGARVSFQEPRSVALAVAGRPCGPVS